MAFGDNTDTTTTKCFLLLGIPLGGGGLIVTSLSHVPPTLAAIWTTTYTQAKFTDMVTTILSYFTVATPAMQSIIQELIGNYDSCRASPMKVTKSGDSEGVLIDHKAQVELLRQELATILGVVCPAGGFLKESNKLYNGLGGSGTGFGMGAGDR